MAATIHTWTNGNADRDWNNGANWSTAAVPGAGGAGLDDAIFDGTVTQVGPNVLMDRSGDVNLKRIVTLPSFTGDIGGVGNALIHAVDTAGDERARIIHRGSGDFYFEGANGGGSFSNVVVDTPGRMYLDSEAVEAILMSVFVKRGYCHVASTGSFGGFAVCDGVAAELEVEAIDSSESEPTVIVVNGGKYTNKRVVSNGMLVVVLGGTLIQTGLIADGATIIVGPQGTLQYTPSAALGAGHNPDIINCGLLDATKSRQDIVFDKYVVGQLASVLGTVVQSGVWSPLYTNCDLREEFP